MPEELKGLVLSGGKGSRLRPFTYTGAKQLVPVANKPVLFYAIEALAEAGVHDIGVIIGDTGDQIREALGDGSRFGVTLTYIEQDAPLGLAHAVKTAAPFLGKSSFLVFLGDNFIRGGIVQFVDAFLESGADCQVLLTPVENPQDFGVAILDDNGRPVKLVEKPAEPPSNLAVVGIYMFNNRFFEAVEQIKPSKRGELEITDTIQKLVDIGADVRAEIVRENWIDTGKMSDILEANHLVLEDIRTDLSGGTIENSKIEGRVILQPGARIVNSVIRGPAIIGQGTEVVDSYIGPYTSIYYSCRIAETEIEASVVLERTVIENPGTAIHASLIGRDVVVSGHKERPRSLRLVLGDHSKVHLP
jgi:glucose-1-phosphate thymidylyltransferase